MTAELDPINEQVKILTANFVDSSSAITSSHGGTTSNLYDRDMKTYWESTSGNRDVTDVTLTIVFKVGTTETQFLMNCFMLFGCNIREMKFEWYDGAAWNELHSGVLPGSSSLPIVQNNADDYIIRYFGAKLTSRVRFTLRNTINPNQLKKISEIVVARHRFNIKNWVNCSPLYREKVTTLTLGDGSEHRSAVKFTTNRTQKYGALVTWEHLTDEECDNLETLKNENASFLFMPQSVYDPENIHLVNWTNPFTPSDTVPKYWGGGKTVQAELREV